jgi:hypothetical protein
MATREYPWIVKWSRHMGSFRYYIEQQVRLARADNAPANAIYQAHDGRWMTTDDITNTSTRELLGLS